MHEALKLLMHTNRLNTRACSAAEESPCLLIQRRRKNVHTNVKAHTDANTQQLSVGFQNKGINHHYTHTQTENGWAGVGVPAGLVKKTH